MTNQVTHQLQPDVIEKLVLKGDLSGLTPAEKVQYYNMICQRVGVDPAMQPFKLLNLQGKHVLYLDRSGAQQLNQLHKVSHAITSREMVTDAGVYQVTARASLPDQRFTESIGAVNISGLKGEAYANAIMKAETKAKRRSTLDLLGLGMLDETEVETIPGAKAEPLPELPKPPKDAYDQACNDVELICQLIDQATDRVQLSNLSNRNLSIFNTNPELITRLKAKYATMPKIA